MKANLKDILESIPDFDDFMKLSVEIGELAFEKLSLENKIKQKESETFREAMRMPNGDGKFPSASYVNSAYTYTGINGEILEYRDRLSVVVAALDTKRIQLSIYRDMLELYRTFSANERSTATY